MVVRAGPRLASEDARRGLRLSRVPGRGDGAASRGGAGSGRRALLDRAARHRPRRELRAGDPRRSRGRPAWSWCSRPRPTSRRTSPGSWSRPSAAVRRSCRSASSRSSRRATCATSSAPRSGSRPLVTRLNSGSRRWSGQYAARSASADTGSPGRPRPDDRAARPDRSDGAPPPTRALGARRGRRGVDGRRGRRAAHPARRRRPAVRHQSCRLESSQSPVAEGRAGMASVFPSLTEECDSIEPAVEAKTEVYVCRTDTYLVRYSRWDDDYDRGASSTPSPASPRPPGRSAARTPGSSGSTSPLTTPTPTAGRRRTPTCRSRSTSKRSRPGRAGSASPPSSRLRRARPAASCRGR